MYRFQWVMLMTEVFHSNQSHHQIWRQTTNRTSSGVCRYVGWEACGVSTVEQGAMVSLTNSLSAMCFRAVRLESAVESPATRRRKWEVERSLAIGQPRLQMLPIFLCVQTGSDDLGCALFFCHQYQSQPKWRSPRWLVIPEDGDTR